MLLRSIVYGLICAMFQCAHSGIYVDDNQYFLVVYNGSFYVEISKVTGNINQLVNDNNKLLSEPLQIANSFGYNIDSVRHYSYRMIDYDSCVLDFFFEDSLAIFQKKYIISNHALYCELIGYNKTDKTTGIGFNFTFPIAGTMNSIFAPDLHATTSIELRNNTTLVYRNNLYIPFLVIFSTVKKTGMGIAVPFEIPKPGLSFTIRSNKLEVQNFYMKWSSHDTVRVGLYLIPNKGDWRSSLNFLYNKYPQYFKPQSKSISIDDGWFYLVNPSIGSDKMKEYMNRNIKSVEMHGYFPFYGLYAPPKKHWNIIRDKDNVTIDDWEERKTYSDFGYEKINDLIDQWHAFGIKVFLYFQIYESWCQYAEKYYSKDITIRADKQPHSSWKFTHLMNPDPESKWGKYIIEQAESLLYKFPHIDGIFYDRMDYNNYDYAHHDHVTVINETPVYMLGFAQERLNPKVNILCKKFNKTIIGNIPTSIEICQNIDALMAENNPNELFKLQYLCLSRPLIYLPYDKTPIETENKLKNALICGSIPSGTYGNSICTRLDEKYAHLFKLLDDRKWVLVDNVLTIPDNYLGNIFRITNNDYVLVIIDPHKSQLSNPSIEYDVSLGLTIPDAEQINFAYSLSGEWEGANELSFKKNEGTLSIDLPQVWSSSVIHLAHKKSYHVSRISSPLLIRGAIHEFIFHFHNWPYGNSRYVRIEMPWMDENYMINDSIVKIRSMIPPSEEGEIPIIISVNNNYHKFSSWIIDPISISLEKDIIIDNKSTIASFTFTNNLNQKIDLVIHGKFSQGEGKVHTPLHLILHPHETKIAEILIETSSEGEIELSTSVGEINISEKFAVTISLKPDDNTLFYDDFNKNMNQWKIITGSWELINGRAQGKGPSHFAITKNSLWSDYRMEVKTRCMGSGNPAIDYLKSYIFFRVKDENNYYRFGIHGDASVLDLYKNTNGKWQKLSSYPYNAELEHWYTLGVVVRGTHIKCYVDGDCIFTIKDKTDAILYGGIGIGVLEDAMQCQYDKVILQKL